MTLDSFTIGRFASYTNAGCPDGDLHITESDRPAVSGGWCGTSWAPAHYYSETNSITLLVRLYTLSSLDNTGYNFDFRLGYKMLNRNRAVVRYGEQQLFSSKFIATPFARPPKNDFSGYHPFPPRVVFLSRRRSREKTRHASAFPTPNRSSYFHPK